MVLDENDLIYVNATIILDIPIVLILTSPSRTD
jgi:hypothetical protein